MPDLLMFLAGLGLFVGGLAVLGVIGLLWDPFDERAADAWNRNHRGQR